MKSAFLARLRVSKMKLHHNHELKISLLFVETIFSISEYNEKVTTQHIYYLGHSYNNTSFPSPLTNRRDNIKYVLVLRLMTLRICIRKYLAFSLIVNMSTF